MTAVPDGWTSSKLGAVAQVYSGGTPSRAEPAYWRGSIPWATTAELDVPVITATREQITALALQRSATRLAPAGTLLMAMYGQGKTRGKTSILGMEAAMNQACAAIEAGPLLSPQFLLAYLRHNYEEIRALSNSGSQDNLSGAIVKSIPVMYPSLPEQLQIAEVVADVNAHISCLERIVAKQQAISLGIQQRLVSGRTRLPGFKGEWKPHRLGDVLEVRHGRSQKDVECPSGSYPILASGGQIGWAAAPIYSKPSVLIGRKGTIDKPRYQEAPFWTVDTLFYTDIFASADPRFLYYFFLTVDWRSKNEASGVPSLSSRQIEQVPVDLPTLPEQRAIARILSEADAEIDVAEARVVKARAIKAGMMQELLSGRTRLTATEHRP